MTKTHDVWRLRLHNATVQLHELANDAAVYGHPFRPDTRAGWQAAMLEFEHQADHWDTPDHGEIGRLIAQALRATVDIARAGGLKCEHREEAARAVTLAAE